MVFGGYWRTDSRWSWPFACDRALAKAWRHFWRNKSWRPFYYFFLLVCFVVPIFASTSHQLQEDGGKRGGGVGNQSGESTCIINFISAPSKVRCVSFHCQRHESFLHFIIPHIFVSPKTGSVSRTTNITAHTQCVCVGSRCNIVAPPSSGP